MAVPFRIVLLTAMLAFCAIPVHAQTKPEDSGQNYLGKLFFSPEEEAFYQKRYQTSISAIRRDQLFDIVETIPGSRHWQALPVATSHQRTIAQSTLDAATAYAANNNSSALIVWRDGRIETSAYFGATAPATPINSFSLAKPLAAVAVGRAIKLGKIKSLDQPAAVFIDEWRDDPLRSQITIRQLLGMRAGLLRQGAAPGPDEIMARSYLHPRSDEILIKEYPVVDAPGTRYEYNNAAYDLLAIVIERATGRRYAEFIGSEILQRIGAPGGNAWLNRTAGLVHAGCCMTLPAETFLRLAILTLRDGVWDNQRLLPAGFVAAMKQATAENRYFGLGLFVAGPYTARRGWANPDLPLPKILHSAPYLAADLYMFDGNMNQIVYVIPSQNLVILRMGGAPPRTGPEWDNAYLPNLIMGGIARDKRSSTPQLR